LAEKLGDQLLGVTLRVKALLRILQEGSIKWQDPREKERVLQWLGENAKVLRGQLEQLEVHCVDLAEKDEFPPGS
jgi:hypothetical protein